MLSEIDVTNWEPEGTEQLGTKPKKWLREPTTETPWLIKYVTFNTTADGTFAKGDDWAERAVGLIAEAMGVPVAKSELAYEEREGHRHHGILVRSVITSANTQLVHGNELLADLGLEVRRPKRKGYTIDNVRRCLEGAAAPDPSTDRFSAWDVFVGYLVLDAVCANTDRHEENWAVLRGESDQLAPSFDHASSLGFNLSDADRSERLATQDALRQVDAWASRAQTPFFGRPHPIDAAVLGLQLVDEGVKAHWTDAVARLELDEFFSVFPSERMSGPAREFAKRVAHSNTQRILSHL